MHLSQEARAVDRRGTELAQRRIMGGCAVTLVLLKAVLRILLRHADHIPVTRDLCQNGSRGDVRTGGIPPNDAPAGKSDAGSAVAVNQGKIRFCPPTTPCS